jgi:dTDP-4-amino-4,6-dideoxygalactose transaminase
MRVDFSPPDITEAEIEAVAEALRSGWITTGPRTKEFEHRLAQVSGTSKLACLNSATAALELALHLLGIGPGDEVITSSYTYTASCSVIYHVGATPVLVDVAPGSYQMDYAALARAITPRTKAVIPVDIAGVMCDYDALMGELENLKERFSPRAGTLQEAFDRVIVLADAAHSFGAVYRSQPSGSVADFTAFSFHAVKNLTTAEGGALTWRSRPGLDDEAIYRQLMLFSLHGQNKDALAKASVGAWEYDVIGPWYKCNMTDIAAALGLVQLERYPQLLERRRQLLDLYAAGLADEKVELLVHDGPGTYPHSHSSRHLCMARLTGVSREFRDRFIVAMAKRDVVCNVHFKPLPLHTAYRERGFAIADHPNALAQFSNQVTLPLHTLLTDEAVQYVIDSFKQSYAECLDAAL